MRIKNKLLIQSKAVFELKYHFGFQYLDRCGSIINAILKEQSEWALSTSSPNPQNAPLVNLKNGCRFNFSATRLDLALEQKTAQPGLSDDDIFEFIGQIDGLAGLIMSELGLKEFSRIGFRVWYLFQCGNIEEAESWLRSLGCYSISKQFEDGFHGKVNAAGVAAIVESEDRKFRVSFNSIERSTPLDIGDGVLNIPPHTLPKGQREHLRKQMRQKELLDENPQFAALIDIDAFQDDPELVHPKEFAESSFKMARDYLEESIGEGGTNRAK